MPELTHTINFWAVLVGGVAYMIIAALWYSPMLFGKTWVKGIGKTDEQVKADASGMNYLWAFIGSLILSYGIARVYLWRGGDTIADGVIVALLAWVCFVLVTMGINDIFEKRKFGLTMVNVFFNFCGMIVIGIIIGAWH